MEPEAAWKTPAAAFRRHGKADRPCLQRTATTGARSPRPRADWGPPHLGLRRAAPCGKEPAFRAAPLGVAPRRSLP
ncbi:hypothetical protein A33M_0549 [Rhodovulum sp. PH10]|nr:hypothetical protein A33M_0549 [Rhodovulum sp. PH10]